MILSFEHLYEFYDVWVVYFGENCNFIIGKFTEFGSLFEFFSAHGFDGEDFIGFAIDSSKHISVLPTSNTFEELIILYKLIHLKIKFLHLKIDGLIIIKMSCQ